MKNNDILDINNYTTLDLKKFFKININKCDKDEIERKSQQVIDKLILANTNNDSKSMEDKRNLLKFINKAKKVLLDELDSLNDELSMITTTYKQNPLQYNEYSNPPFSTPPHFVQNTNVINSKYPNPVNILYKTRLFTFNTIYAEEFIYEKNTIVSNPILKGDSTGAQDYTFHLINPVKNVIGMSLAAFQYPNVQYTFSKNLNNNKFFIDVITTGVKGVIEIPNGYYENDQSNLKTYFPPILEKYINIALYGTYVALVPYDPNVVNTNNNFAVNSSPYTRKITITNTKNDNFQMVFDMPTWDISSNAICNQKYPYSQDLPDYYDKNKLQPNTFGFQIGFRSIVYDTPVFFGGYAMYTGEAQYDSGNNAYVFFTVDEFANNYLDEVTAVFPNYFFDNKILGYIPISSPHFTSDLDTGANFIFKSRNYAGPIDISKIVVAVYSSSGIKIAFNQVPFSFALEFKTLYENPVTTDQIRPPYA